MADEQGMPGANDRVGGASADSSADDELTPTERYLRDLCQRNFLSFWSHPRPFRAQGGPKELCDLLVVMGDDVIIFSDKHCELNPNVEIGVAWKRWFRAAVEGAAKQAWGAERWLREHPDRVFADDSLLRRLPVEVPDPATARYHLVVTVHGIAKPCRAAFGGSGSLILNTSIKGTSQHDQPFTIGDLDPGRTFVHVLDDTTMDIVLETLDTIADFVRYLREKERVCRLEPAVAAAGEENLLAYYLTHLNDDGEHAMVIPSDANYIALDETFWPHFEQSDERRAQLDHDEVSYRWDALIERFAAHALTGTQYAATEPVLQSSEKVLRFLAAETRFRRRLLANALLEAVRNTPPNIRFLRVLPSQAAGEPMYVFVAFPWSE